VGTLNNPVATINTYAATAEVAPQQILDGVFEMDHAQLVEDFTRGDSRRSPRAG
jgi:hypothetical protein